MTYNIIIIEPRVKNLMHGRPSQLCATLQHFALQWDSNPRASIKERKAIKHSIQYTVVSRLTTGMDTLTEFVTKRYCF